MTGMIIQITRKFEAQKPFHEAANHIGKTIVFGHTPVYGLLNQERVQRNFDQKTVIGMDGGAVYGGVLHGIVLY